ncbi:hypothetical protein [Aeromicrobium sp. Leaf350]|uniref:hypothetical protein n=1 Tax=Aeromicrobium sp. Leaf350 TaxID=2876565 RepID=UPI001E504B16|nr:hypothetical protein [Aeromicrobium sp. Leaf350]
MSEFLTPEAPRDLRASLAFSVLAGAVSAVPIGRASRRTRRLVAGLAAGGTALAAAVAVRDLLQEADAPPRLSPRELAAPAATAGAAAAVAAGVMASSFAVDRRMEAALVKRGVTRPRLLIGVAAAVMSFLADRVDGRFGDRPAARRDGVGGSATE